MYTLAISEWAVLPKLPWKQRVRAIAKADFSVDLGGWQESEVDDIGSDADVHISGMPGGVGGSMVHPQGLEAFMDGVEKNLDIARRLRCRNLALLTGQLDSKGQASHPIAEDPAARWIAAYNALCRVAELAHKHDVIYNIETLNRKDHPGYPLFHVEQAIALIEQVGSDRIKWLCDVYHLQMEQGNMVQRIRNYREYIGYVHVADVPGRHEPGTGEINYPKIAEVLRDVEFKGYIALEAFPLASDMEAMSKFRKIFS